MRKVPEEWLNFDELETRIRTILPELYQDSYQNVQPTSMGSAPLKYAADGTVAWDEMWGSFCDLAMAGGPPHKGALLEPGIATQSTRYDEVVSEICRGVALVTGLAADPAPEPGWIAVDCYTTGMAGWLFRAIIMENVLARLKGMTLFLPAGPDYRLEKEIKNVITVMAKTCHYWSGHTSLPQRRRLTNLFIEMETESPLVQPAASAVAGDFMADAIFRETGLDSVESKYSSWLGLECGEISRAIWMMRASTASNVLSRREGSVVFVPVNPADDPEGAATTRGVVRTYRLGVARGVFPK